MEIRKVTAIVNCSAVKGIEEALDSIGVSGVTVTRVKGHGEGKNLFFSSSPDVTHACAEVFADKSRAEHITWTILEAAHTGYAGDGLVAVLPVERVWRIRTKKEATADDLG